MYARERTSKVFVNNRTARFSAYLAIVIMSIAVTIFVMAGVEGEAAIPAEPSLYAVWTIAAGAIGGAASLYAARGWLGLSGGIGYARAVVGSLKRFQLSLNQRGFTAGCFSDSSFSGGSDHAQPAFCRYSSPF